ncbi:hypothetical protein F5Y07DRAFT_383146 [Xylaria sp. FL0933]|nr:hypothetical protein F5Y07DRAFT_383146 [Xylaria sp. FL0933]
MESPLPKAQSAIVASDIGDLVISHNSALPRPAPDSLLVEIVAVSLTPVDVNLRQPRGR